MKYVITILLFYELSNGEIIQECFGLYKIEGHDYFYYLSRDSLITVDISCDNGFIHLGHLIYSIPKNYSNLCPSDGCSISFGEYICNCCKVKLYPTDECKVTYFFSDIDRQHCEGYKRCTLKIGILDLNLYCQYQLHYECDKDLCKSRWVDIEYECVPGRTTEQLALIIAFKVKNITVQVLPYFLTSCQPQIGNVVFISFNVSFI